ncbi:AAA family ATPase [Azospirillum baldaniorum]|uniref:AAA family ATPase n=1 Tax=Azospirillum argentinense TaxID=2970906 RepID=A0A2K1FV21_9PROT|nr:MULTISPECIES: isopentenyl transferase family protein [Azospirillum]AWJ89990.1 AAA family ATPase [Azospirillum baldaniorum]PNQ96387.1 AAA family ATPase [Azospirillum argentinense]TWA77475.1 adenylate kinase family enzyme [Azospirillum brasilense]
MQLSDLGHRICILGPSNSGKSTLAEAIARQRGFPVVHLDRLYHAPNTDWQPRPTEEFVALHDAAIAGERWVMEGNYSRCIPQRFQRATGLIYLDVPMPLSLLRYFRRTLFERERRGALEGRRDSIKWEMIRHIAVTTPRNRARNLRTFDQADLPKIRIDSARDLNAWYRRWDLTR